MAYVIRKAKLEDIDAINELLYQVHELHVKIRPDLFVDGVKKYTDKEIVSIMKNPKKPIFVYTENDVVKGYCFCIIEEEKNASKVQHKSLYIDDLCVDKNVLHQSIGTHLYEYAKMYAKMMNCDYITLNVWEGNDNAYNFYKHLGLKEQKRILEEKL